MSCQNCAGLAMPECGGPAILICVRQDLDAVTIPAWVTAVCTLDEITSFALFQDAAATVPLVGYTIGDRVPCPTSLLGSTCETADNVNLCPETLEALEVQTEAQTAALLAGINTIIDDQTTALNANIDAMEAAIIAAINHPADPNYVNVLTYTANGDVETITRTTAVAGFAPCEVQTYTYNGSFQLTGISAWVACP